MPIFQLFARKINLNWVLLFIALTSVLGNCLMIIDNRYVFLFGYAVFLFLFLFLFLFDFYYLNKMFLDFESTKCNERFTP